MHEVNSGRESQYGPNGLVKSNNQQNGLWRPEFACDNNFRVIGQLETNTYSKNGKSMRNNLSEIILIPVKVRSHDNGHF